MRPRSVDLGVSELPSRGISWMLSRPPARLHRESTAHGLTKAVGGTGHHDRSFGRHTDRPAQLARSLRHDISCRLAPRVPADASGPLRMAEDPWRRRRMIRRGVRR